MKTGILAVIMAGVLTACNVALKSTDQSSVCVFATKEEATKCGEGQLAWYAPGRWGNEQLPLMAVATYCNTNYQIVSNNSGVVCVLTHKRLGDVR